MRNLKARRMLAALSPVLVAIFLVASMGLAAAQSSLQYAIVSERGWQCGRSGYG